MATTKTTTPKLSAASQKLIEKQQQTAAKASGLTEAAIIGYGHPKADAPGLLAHYNGLPTTGTKAAFHKLLKGNAGTAATKAAATRKAAAQGKGTKTTKA